LGVVVPDALDGRARHGVPKLGGLEAGAGDLEGELISEARIIENLIVFYLQFTFVFGMKEFNNWMNSPGFAVYNEERRANGDR
jgi:hypothetical protein